MAVQYYEGIGRRKEAIARVRVMTGSGVLTVNQVPAESYFGRTGDMETILAPLVATGENRTQLDITIVVRGGGVTGQAEAARLGVARAILKMNPDLLPALRKSGYLTRDAREKERKKPGLKRARKAPTYTKR